MITTQNIIDLVYRVSCVTQICNGGQCEDDFFNEFPGEYINDIDVSLGRLGCFMDYLDDNGYNPFVDELREALCEFLDCSTEQPSQDTPRRLADLAKERITNFCPDDEDPQDLVLMMEDIINKCAAWVKWIQFYQPGQATPTSQASKREPTAAAKRLASQDLQALKQELIKAGLIAEGRWEGTPAEYGELVRHLKDDCGVENRGGHAWQACRPFAGYQGSDKSAQNAITSNQGDIRGERAAMIRRICQRHKVS